MNILSVIAASVCGYLMFLLSVFFSDRKIRNKEEKKNIEKLNKLKDIAETEAKKSTDTLEEVKERLNKYVRKE